MNRSDLIKAVIWLDQVASQAKSEAAKLRDELAADARAEFDEQGAAPTWRIPDLATVAASVSHESAYVEHEAEFTRWVAERYPHNIAQVVRPAFAKVLLESAAIHYHGADLIAADPETGEVIPGVAVRPGGVFAGLSIRPTSAAREVFGALASHGLRELAAKASPAVPVVLAELAPQREAADA